MRCNEIRYLLLVLFLMVVLGSKACAQGTNSLDLNLSLLRGSWEVHTFYDKWTLVFDCDDKMLFDRGAADYSLMPGVIRVRDNDGTTDYPYKLEGNSLTLTLPDGSERKYRRTDPGSAEQSVHGNFVAPADSSMPEESISFDGDSWFVLNTFSPATVDKNQPTQERGGGHVSMFQVNGLYRVEGDVVVLTFGDSTSRETQIRSRDEDGSVAGIVLFDRLFTSEKPVAAMRSPESSVEPAYTPDVSPDVYIVPVYVPQAPPSPAVTPLPVGAALPSQAGDKGSKSNTPPRPFGTTRGKPTGR
jgi:hypothetical protein